MDEHRFVLDNHKKMTIDDMGRKIGGVNKVKSLMRDVGLSYRDGLNDKEADEAKKMYFNGEAIKTISIKFNVSSGVVMHLSRKWRDVDNDEIKWQTKWLSKKL